MRSTMRPESGDSDNPRQEIIVVESYTEVKTAVNPPSASDSDAPPETVHDVARRKMKRTMLMKDGWQPMVAHSLVLAIQKGYSYAKSQGGELLLWDGGVYQPTSWDTIARTIVWLFDTWIETRRWSTHVEKEAISLLKRKVPTIWETPPMDTINLANGLLDIQSRELRPHEPEFLSMVQLPVAYDPEATCPAWSRFISQVFPEDSEALAWEILGWLMTTRRIGQKAVLLLGEGGNGKSTYLRAVRAFLGDNNTSSESIHSLESNRWSTVKLIGKLANIYPDLPHTRLQSSSIFEQLTGGDSRINAEYKFKTPFDFEPFCKLVFSTRRAPRVTSAARAFYDRWLVVPFDRDFRGTEQEMDQEDLVRQLSQPQELSGALNMALVGMADVVKRGGFFETLSTKNALLRFQGQSDPLLLWIRQHISREPSSLVPIQEFYDSYKSEMLLSDTPVASDNAFGACIKKEFPRVERVRKSLGGKRPWCYQGVRLS